MNEGAAVTSPAAALRLARILKFAFAISAILFLSVVLRVPAKATQPPDPMVVAAITILAFANIVLGFVFPRYYLRNAQRVPGNAQQATPIQRWFTANVLGFALIESCSLFGVMLHFLGAELGRSNLLIGVGVVATLFFSVGAPPESEEGSAGRG
jgi:hypothetical protein